MKILQVIKIMGVTVLVLVTLALAAFVGYGIGQEVGVFPDQFSEYKHLE